MLPRTCSASMCCVLWGLLLICSGSLLAIFWPRIYNHIVVSNLELKPGGMSYGLWKDPPITMYIEFYFFNWTNSEDVYDKNTKPRFQEIGPYRFTETKEKKEIVWNANGTISFRQGSLWFFDPENSNGSLSDKLTTVNVIALTSAYVSRDWSRWVVLPLSQVLKSHSVNITHTVGEFLFEGFDDPLIRMGKVGSIFAQNIQVPFDKFGWFYMRNGTLDHSGAFNMNTGVGDISKIGVMERWNYGNSTDFYPDSCSKVTGSAGELFPPNQQKNGSIEIYSPDICRSIHFDYDAEVVVEGLPGYQYTGGRRNMDNGTLDPSNACYCGGDCVPSGAVNVSTCRFGAPAFVSYPHFYQADPYFLNQVDGLTPDEEKHKFYITLEPTTGIPLDVAARLQINVLMQPYKNIAIFADLPKVFVPMLWFQQRASISPELASSLGQLLILSPLGSIGALTAVFVGVITVVTVVVLYYYSSQSKKSRKIQLEKSPITDVILPLMGKPTKPSIDDSVYFDASTDRILDKSPTPAPTVRPTRSKVLPHCSPI